MSTAELSGDVLARTPSAAAAHLRLLGSELALTFRRRRNQGLLLLLATVPIIIGTALRLNAPSSDSGAPQVIKQVAGNGVFLSLAALFFLLPLILPLAVSVVCGDAIAGEAGTGTLRYLLAVPAGRTRLLVVKYAAAISFCAAAVGVVALAGLLTGLALFPVGPVTLLSGTTVPLGEGLLRLALIGLYIVAGIATLAAIGLAVSTVTDSPIAAITTTAVLPVASQVIDAVPQLSPLHPYLFTHWWFCYDDLLRDPMMTGRVGHGLIVFLAYSVLFGSAAWARFTTKDVTS